MPDRDGPVTMGTLRGARWQRLAIRSPSRVALRAAGERVGVRASARCLTAPIASCGAGASPHTRSAVVSPLVYGHAVPAGGGHVHVDRCDRSRLAQAGQLDRRRGRLSLRHYQPGGHRHDRNRWHLIPVYQCPSGRNALFLDGSSHPPQSSPDGDKPRRGAGFMNGSDQPFLPRGATDRNGDQVRIQEQSMATKEHKDHMDAIRSAAGPR